MRIVIRFVVMVHFALAMSGCGTVFYNVGNAESKNMIPKNGNEVRSSYVFVGETIETGVLCGKNDVYVFERSRTDEGNNYYEVYGVSKEFKEYFWFGGKGEMNQAQAFAHILSKLNVSDRYRITVGQPKSLKSCEGDSISIDYIVMYNAMEVHVDYIDRTLEMQKWRSGYDKNKLVKIGDYVNFVKPFPRSAFSQGLMKEMFGKFFSIKVTGKDSAPRSETAGGIASSYAGSCKDMTKNVKISKITPESPGGDIRIKVKYKLERTYEPYYINEKGDPLFIDKEYTLNRRNNYSIMDSFEYKCVMTAGRFHNAALSLIGKFVGASGKDSGINTTLTKTSFSMDVFAEVQ